MRPSSTMLSILINSARSKNDDVIGTNMHVPRQAFATNFYGNHHNNETANEEGVLSRDRRYMWPDVRAGFTPNRCWLVQFLLPCLPLPFPQTFPIAHTIRPQSKMLTSLVPGSESGLKVRQEMRVFCFDEESARESEQGCGGSLDSAGGVSRHSALCGFLSSKTLILNGNEVKAIIW